MKNYNTQSNEALLRNMQQEINRHNPRYGMIGKMKDGTFIFGAKGEVGYVSKFSMCYAKEGETNFVTENNFHHELYFCKGTEINPPCYVLLENRQIIASTHNPITTMEVVAMVSARNEQYGHQAETPLSIYMDFGGDTPPVVTLLQDDGVTRLCHHAIKRHCKECASEASTSSYACGCENFMEEGISEHVYWGK